MLILNDDLERNSAEENRKSSYFFLSSYLTKTFSFSYTKSIWKNINLLKNPHESIVMNRSPICEITYSQKIIAIRSKNGLCSIFDSLTGDQITYLNDIPGEIIRSTFYNSCRNELIKISITPDEAYTALISHCYKCDDLYNSRLIKTQLFVDDKVKYPGFIEFDNANSKAILYISQKNVYKVFSLKDYQLLYEINSTGITDTKMTPGALMLISLVEKGRIIIKFSDLETGKIGGAMSVSIESGKNIELIERINSYVIVKQFSMPLISYNIENGGTKIIEGTDRNSTDDFLFLYIPKIILVYKGGYFDVYNFQGDFIFKIETDEYIDSHPVCASKDQEYFLCASHKNSIQRIHVFDISTSEKIFTGDIDFSISGGFKITVMSYDENINCIVCGDEVGTAYFWV